MSVVEISQRRTVRVSLGWCLLARQSAACWASECWRELAQSATSPRIRLYARAKAVVTHDRVLRDIDGQPSRIAP